jgi:MFS family permease
MYRGWVVVWASFALMFLGFGAAYTFTSFFDALSAEFNTSRGALSLVFSVAGFLYFALGAISGPLSDRFGPRRVIGLGVAITGVGLILAGVARSLNEVLLAYALGVGIGVGFTYVPSIGVVQRWFLRRRGQASGAAVTGIGLGTIVLPSLAAWLIALMGWRASYIALGLVTLALGFAATALIEASPAARGLNPDGDPTPPPAAAAPTSGLSLREALRRPLYWSLYGCYVVLGFGLFVPFVHLVPYAQDHGVERALAILLFTLIGVGSTLGRFLLGGPADRFGRKRGLVLLFIGMAVMQLAWLGSERFWSLAVYALVYGACYGGFVALVPALTIDYFGPRSAAGIIGVLYTSVAIGTLVGPAYAGFAFDLSGSYTLSIATNAATALIAAIWLALLRAPRGQ